MPSSVCYESNDILTLDTSPGQASYLWGAEVISFRHRSHRNQRHCPKWSSLFICWLTMIKAYCKIISQSFYLVSLYRSVYKLRHSYLIRWDALMHNIFRNSLKVGLETQYVGRQFALCDTILSDTTSAQQSSKSTLRHCCSVISWHLPHDAYDSWQPFLMQSVAKYGDRKIADDIYRHP